MPAYGMFKIVSQSGTPANGNFMVKPEHITGTAQRK